MITRKTLALSAVIGLGLAGSAAAQVYPGIAGTPGRGNSGPVAVMPNGGVVSNGYLAEPYQFVRGPIERDHGEGMSLRGSPDSPNAFHW